MEQLKILAKKWKSDNVEFQRTVGDNELSKFQSSHNIVLPNELINYFKNLNGTGEEYDGNFFQFYSLNQLKTINEEYKDWKGIPNYKNIVNTLIESEQYFVFANYSCHLFSYAIRFNSSHSINNDILVLCGDEYKKIANSFSEFIELYLKDYLFS